MVIEPIGYAYANIRSPRHHISRAGRSDAARHSGSPRARRGFGNGARRTIHDQSARDLEAPENPRARRADHGRSGCTTATPSSRGETACRGECMARAISRELGSQLRAPRWRPRGVETVHVNARTEAPAFANATAGRDETVAPRRGGKARRRASWLLGPPGWSMPELLDALLSDRV